MATNSHRLWSRRSADADVALTIGRADPVTPMTRAGGDLAVGPWRREDAMVFLATAAPTLLLGLWLAVGRHVYHPDAVARTYSAMQVVHGYEPKLANLGLVWPALPSLAQVPFALLLPSLSYQGGTGPIVSALSTAIALVLLNRILTHHVPERQIRYGLLALFLTNPLILSLAISGLSEMLFVAFILLAWRAFQRLCFEEPLPQSQVAVMGIAAAGAFLSRVEGVVYGIVFGAVLMLLLYRRTYPRVWSVTEGVTVAYFTPFVYTIGLFILFNATIMGDPLYFATGKGSQQELMSSFLQHTSSLQTLVDDPLASARYVLSVSWHVMPAFFLAVPLVAALAIFKRDIGLAGLVAIAVISPVIQWSQSIAGQSAGWTRYYVTNVLFSLLLLTSCLRPGVFSPRWIAPRMLSRGVLLLLLVSNILSGISLRDSSARSDFPPRYLPALISRPSGASIDQLIQRTDQERVVGAYLRDTLFAAEPDALVLVDDTEANRIILFSGRADRFVAPNSTQFAEFIANPVGNVDYILVPDVPPSRDPILQQHPRLFDEGMPSTTLVAEFVGPWTHSSLPFSRWRLYRVEEAVGARDYPSVEDR